MLDKHTKSLNSRIVQCSWSDLSKTCVYLFCLCMFPLFVSWTASGVPSETLLMEPSFFQCTVNYHCPSGEKGTQELCSACNTYYLDASGRFLFLHRSTSRCHAETAVAIGGTRGKAQDRRPWVGKSRVSGSRIRASWTEQWASLTLYQLERRENGHTALRSAAPCRARATEQNNETETKHWPARSQLDRHN